MKSLIVPLADLERGPKHQVWELDRKWLMDALDGTEATVRGAGNVDVVLTKNGVRVVVRGRVTAPLRMPCARTLDPVDVDVDAEVMLVLSPARVPMSSSRRKATRKSASRASQETSVKGQKAGIGQVAKDREITQEEAAEDVYAGSDIVLDAFVREHIILELPMFPLRSDLRANDKPAIPARPEDAKAKAGTQIDPRLAPLLAVANRMKQETKE